MSPAPKLVHRKPGELSDEDCDVIAGSVMGELHRQATVNDQWATRSLWANLGQRVERVFVREVVRAYMKTTARIRSKRKPKAPPRPPVSPHAPQP